VKEILKTLAVGVAAVLIAQALANRVAVVKKIVG